ncbi:hypothetical protein EIP86_010871 [Pleurotus ostreatoroseus]|nr:hypothetical protein EIP86_010871 [Pleurotus ostreatoroseus]
MLKWPPPTKDKTALESKRLFSPTPDDLTASAFVKDSAVCHLDADGDEIMSAESSENRDALAAALEARLKTAQRRRDDAIHLLETYFPAVLPRETREATTTSALSPESECSEHTFIYESPTSIDPEHLHLNLRILDFIETTRTVPLPYHHPGSPVITPARLPPPPVARSETSGEELDPHLELLLHKAQRLYSEANCLPKATDRAVYLKELGIVSALLAYTKPEDSLMTSYLSQERREAVADQIERAILHHLGESAVSHLELCTRYTTTMWDWLHENSTKLPSRNKWPPGVELSGLTSAKDTETASVGKAPGKKTPDKEPERAPRFSLAEFLTQKV